MSLARRMAPEVAKFDADAMPCVCDRLPLLVVSSNGDNRLECPPCGARTHPHPTPEAARAQWAAMNPAA